MQERQINRWVDRGFAVVEGFIYLVLGVLLAAAAAIFLIASAVEFFGHLFSGQLNTQIVALLGELLLVLLIAELLYTVKVSFSAGSIVLEPFLFIGLIAAIRRVFVLTAEYSEATGIKPVEFRQFIIELGALSLLILVISISLLLLRKSATYEKHLKRSTESDSNND